MINYKQVAKFNVPGFGSTTFRVLYSSNTAILQNPPPGAFLVQRLEFDEMGGERWVSQNDGLHHIPENTPLGFLLKNRLVPDK